MRERRSSGDRSRVSRRAGVLIESALYKGREPDVGCWSSLRVSPKRRCRIDASSIIPRCKASLEKGRRRRRCGYAPSWNDTACRLCLLESALPSPGINSPLESTMSAISKRVSPVETRGQQANRLDKGLLERRDQVGGGADAKSAWCRRTICADPEAAESSQ